jgi:hypothetical protein
VPEERAAAAGHHHVTELASLRISPQGHPRASPDEQGPIRNRASSAGQERCASKVSSDCPDDVVEAGRVGRVLAHLIVPAAFVPLDPVLEPVAEGCWVKSARPCLSFEERPDLIQVDVHVLGESPEVVQVAVLDALDDAAQLLRADLFKGVDVERDRAGQVWPDSLDSPLFDGVDEFVRSDIEFDLPGFPAPSGPT